MELLPIGSIISITGKKFCIIGYSDVKKEEKAYGGYVVVLYPLGYISLEQAIFVPAVEPVEVVAYGYQSKTSKELIKLLGTYYDVAKEIGEEKTAAIFEVYKIAAQNLEEKNE